MAAEQPLWDAAQYDYSKLAPARPATRRTDIFVSRKRRPEALLRRAHHLLFVEQAPYVVLHALGAAVQTALSLALELRARCGEALTIGATTFTVALVDEFAPRQPVTGAPCDFERWILISCPDAQGAAIVAAPRLNSAIRIELSLLQPPKRMALSSGGQTTR